MEIKFASKEHLPAWDEFVINSKETTFLHLSGWRRVVELTFGHEAYYLMAQKQGEIKGIIPLFGIKSRILGNFYSSMQGGICTDSGNGEETAYHLIQAILNMTRQAGFAFAVIRDCSRIWDSDLAYTSPCVDLILELPNNQNSLWRKISPKARQNVRQARRNGLLLSSDLSNLAAFYNAMAINYRRLGTPTFGLNLFTNMIDVFPDNANLITTTYEGKVIGGIVLFRFKDTMYAPWVSSDPRYFPLRPNNFLYWEALKYSINQGCGFFDFGTSPVGSGHVRFKEQWGAKAHPVYNLYFLNKIRTPPEPFILVKRPVYRLLQEAWKRLPLSLTKRIGPKLAALMPIVT